MVRYRNKINNLKPIDNHMTIKVANGHNLKIKELREIGFFYKKILTLYMFSGSL